MTTNVAPEIGTDETLPSSVALSDPQQQKLPVSLPPPLVTTIEAPETVTTALVVLAIVVAYRLRW